MEAAPNGAGLGTAIATIVPAHAGNGNGADPDPMGPATAPSNGYDPQVKLTARQMVEGSDLPQAQIAYRLGVSEATLTNWKREGGWTRPEGAPEARVIGRTKAARKAAVRRSTAEVRRTRLIGRLFKTFERQVAEIEARFADPAARTEEKDARTLGSLARTLETLMALERDDGPKAREPEPVDRDELRAALARRIAQWAEEAGQSD